MLLNVHSETRLRCSADNQRRLVQLALTPARRSRGFLLFFFTLRASMNTPLTVLMQKVSSVAASCGGTVKRCCVIGDILAIQTIEHGRVTHIRQTRKYH